MRLKLLFLPTAVLVFSIVPSAHAQLSEAATHGKTVFDTNCAICHKTDSTDMTIGPGLKGLYARGVMQDGTTKVTDETVTERINVGKSPMPGFKDSLEPQEIKDLVEYLKTL